MDKKNSNHPAGLLIFVFIYMHATLIVLKCDSTMMCPTASTYMGLERLEFFEDGKCFGRPYESDQTNKVFHLFTHMGPTEVSNNPPLLLRTHE